MKFEDMPIYFGIGSLIFALIVISFVGWYIVASLTHDDVMRQECVENYNKTDCNYYECMNQIDNYADEYFSCLEVEELKELNKYNKENGS